MALRLSPEQRRARARLAANTRHHGKQTDLATEDQRTLRVAACERSITDLVNNAPLPTAADLDRLRALLGYDGGGDLGGHDQRKAAA